MNYIYSFFQKDKEWKELHTFEEKVDYSRKLDIKQSICDITKIFKDITFLKSDSASQTIQFFTKVKDAQAYELFRSYFSQNDDFFIKMSFEENINDPQNNNNNSLQIERVIYKYLTYVVLYNHTPHIMNYVASFKCNNMNDYFDSEMCKNTTECVELNEKTVEIFKSIPDPYKYDWNIANFLVLERGKGNTFVKKKIIDGTIQYSFWEDDVSLNDMMAVIFQIYFTLHELSTVNVRHNDLHLQNIWIEKRKPKTYYYFVDKNTYFMIHTPYFAKIYDFDHSTFTKGTYTNTLLSKFICKKFGECSVPNPKFDGHTFASSLAKQLSHLKNVSLETKNYLKKFIETLIPSQDFRGYENNDYVYQSHLCKISGRECEKDWLPDDKDVLSPYDFIVNSGFFNIWKHDILDIPWQIIDNRNIVTETGVFSGTLSLPISTKQYPRDVFDDVFVWSSVGTSVIDIMNRIIYDIAKKINPNRTKLPRIIPFNSKDEMEKNKDILNPKFSF